MEREYHLKLNDRTFKVKVPVTSNEAIEVGEDVHNALAEQINANNETENIIFYEELLVVCKECAKVLDTEEEEVQARCDQCSALYCCECDTKLSEKEQEKDNYMCDKCEEKLENE